MTRNRITLVVNSQIASPLMANLKGIKLINRSAYTIRFAFEAGQVTSPAGRNRELTGFETFDSGDQEISSGSIYFFTEVGNGAVIEIIQR